MAFAGWLLTVVILGQVPAPGAAAELSAQMRQETRAIREREESRLAALADGLASQGQAAEAEAVRALIEPAPSPDGPTRFVPLPEVIPPVASVPAGAQAVGPANAEARQIRTSAAEAWFKVADQALHASQFALADECLRRVVDRQPDHAEARRLLGYVRHNGGWASPFAVRALREGSLYHRTFGWIPADWIPHLEQGELPAPSASGRPLRWLPAAEADDLRRDFAVGWKVDTPHFQIRANVPLSEAIAFGHRLEDFHEAFVALMADVIDPQRLPLAQRFRKKTTATDLRPADRHLVRYFATKDQYVAYLQGLGLLGSNAELGRYLPREESLPLGEPPTSYFYKDLADKVGAVATLYHEVSHQLLFETAGPSTYWRNAGNYWVFEGLGTYFETVTPQPDGSLLIGVLAGPRVEEAAQLLVVDGKFVPLAQFVALDMKAFLGGTSLHYAEAMALTIFLMQADGRRHREAFLDYVHDAYRGQLRGARALADHLDERYEELDRRLLEFLLSGTAGRRPSPGSDRE